MLPFVVQPRQKPRIETIGTDESGKIEIERRGYLTTGEKAWVQQVQQYDDGSSEIVTVSRNVARKFSLGMDHAYKLVLKIISATAADSAEESEMIDAIEKDFAEELTAVVKGLAMGQAKQDLVYAACMLQYRVDSNFKVADINSVHPDLVQALAQLYRDEEARSLEAFQSTQPEDAEDAPEPSIEEKEKKQGKPGRTRSKSTSGDSSEPSLETQTSP